METIATNQDNDIYLDVYNNIAISSDLLAVANVCKNAVLTRYNELLYNKGVGVPYLETIFTDKPNISAFQVAIMETLKNVKNVIKVKNFTYEVNNGLLKYSVNITTKFCEVNING